MNSFHLARTTVLVLSAATCFACGSNQEERGIETEREVATPVDPAELSETEKERQADFVEEME